MDKYDQQAESLLPCVADCDAPEEGHNTDCPAHYRPAVAARMRKQAEWWDEFRARGEDKDLASQTSHGCICDEPERGEDGKYIWNILPECQYHAKAFRYPSNHSIPWNCPTFYDHCNCKQSITDLRAKLAAAERGRFIVGLKKAKNLAEGHKLIGENPFGALEWGVGWDACWRNIAHRIQAEIDKARKDG